MATRSRIYREGKLESEDLPVDQVASAIEQAGTIAWIDVSQDDREAMSELAGLFDLHELAIDDVHDEGLRPKLHHYQNHMFVAASVARLTDGAQELTHSPIYAFMGSQWLITVHGTEQVDVAQVLARWDRSPELVRTGPQFLLYGMLDMVVDGYFDVVDELDSYYDDVAERTFDEHPMDRDDQQRWFYARRSAVRLHRLVVPMREVVSALLRQGSEDLDRRLVAYYQDLYDHVLQVSESIEALRDLMSSIVDTSLMLREHRTNRIMKRVTSWAAIIAVPTLITGYYGMNVPYPGVGQTWGFLVSVAVIVLASSGLYLAFRRNDWL